MHLHWKRKLSALLAGAMLLGAAPPAAFAAWSAPEAEGWATASREGVAARFFVGSDTHIGRDSAASNKLKNALDVCYRIDPDTDGVLLVGDVTNNGAASEYTSLTNIIKGSALGQANKVLLTMGNHEFNSSAATAVSRFESQLGQAASEVLYYSSAFGAVTASPTADDNLVATVVKLSASNYGGDYTGNYDLLKTALETSQEKNESAPVIVMGHHGIQNTAYVTNEWYGNYGKGTDRDMVALLEQYPQAIHISGHSHATLEDARSIYQNQGYTAIQDGTIGAYFENEKGKVDPDSGAGATRPSNSEIASQALRIDVLEDGGVAIYRLNLTTGEYIFGGEPWAFDVADHTDRPYDGTRESETAPAFAEEAAVTAGEVTDGTAIVRFPAATAGSRANNDMIHTYTLKLTPQGSGGTVTRSVFADYYEETAKSEWSVKITGLDADTTYDVSVTAKTSFGMSSDAITGTVTTAPAAAYETPKPDILNIDFRTDSTADANGHTLAVKGAPVKAQDDKIGTFYRFDGTDDGLRYAMTAADYNKFKSGYTMECYMKLDGIKGNPFSNQESAGCGFELNSDGKTLEFWNRVGGSYKKPTSNIAALKNDWIHAVATFDGKQTKLYINGALKAAVEGAGTMAVPADGAKYFYVGADTRGDGTVQNPIACDIALALLYTGAMNAADVQKTYEAVTKNAGGDTESETPAADMLHVDFADGTASDRSETGNTVRAAGSPVIQEDAEMGKKVASFNGEYDAYLYAFDDEKYGKMNTATIESVFCYDEVPASGEYDIFSNQQSGGMGLGLENGRLQFYCNLNRTAGGNGYVQPSAAIEAGIWYHAVGVFDGAKVKLYLNGELVAEKDATGPTIHWTTSANAKSFVIGGDSSSSGGAEFFAKGSVSLARLYSKGLTEQQVKALYERIDPPVLTVSGETGRMEQGKAAAVAQVRASNGQTARLTDITVNGESVMAAEYDAQRGEITPARLGDYTFTYTLSAQGKTQTKTIVRACVADASAKVSLGLVTADTMAAGASYNVNVHARRDADAAADHVRFELHYDPAVLEYVRDQHWQTADPVTDDGGGTLTIDQKNTGISTEPFSNYAATRLVKLSFRVKDAAKAGVTALTFANITAQNGGRAVSEAVGVTGEDKTITILSQNALDKNGDGVIGAGDVAMAGSTEEAKAIAAAAAIYPYKHVLAITMDGGGVCFRPDQMYYAARSSTVPSLTSDAAILSKRVNDYAMRLFNETFATSYTAKSETPTISAQNYTAILHGKEYATAQSEYKIDNTKTGAYYYPDFGKAEPVYPSVFKALQAAQPNRGNAAFAEWNQIVNGIIEPDAGVDTYAVRNISGQSAGFADVADYILSDAFDNTALLYFQSDYMDGVGHGSGFYNDNYYAQLKKYDAYFQSIMDALAQKDAVEDTLVIVNSDHGGNGTSHGGTTQAEYDVQLALGGQTIDGGKRLEGGTNHDPSVIALTALRADVPASMDGSAALLEQAGLNQEELAAKGRTVETVTATAGTNVDAVELKLSGVQNGNAIRAADIVMNLNGQSVKAVDTRGTILRQEVREGALYLTLAYTESPEVLARVNLNGPASGVKVTEFMLGTAAGKEIYGDLINTAGELLPETTVTADKTALQSLYTANRDKTQGGYTAQSWTVFQQALAAAKAVLNNEAATQAEVDGAKDALQAAVDGLRTGGGSSSGGSSSGSSGGRPSKPSVTTTTGATSDGAKVTTVTDTKTGAVTQTIESADGVKTTVLTPKNGGVTAQVNLPTGKTSAIVAIPLESASPGTVAVLVKPDGAEAVVKASYVENGELRVPVTGGCTLKIVDNSKAFADVPADKWYAESVAFATSRELFNGVSENTFSPHAPMTRAMLATVLYRYDGEQNGAAGETWYAAAVDWAKAKGISDGARLNGPITREQLAVMLYRYAGGAAEAGTLSFADADMVSGWARDAVAWAADKGILTGRSADRLDPKGSATRAEVAAMLMRFCKAA